MAKKLYEESNIYDIACAIREKCGGSGTYKTCDMPDAIRALSVAADPVIKPLNVVQNGTFNVPSGTDGYNPVTVNVATPKPVIQSLNITTNGTYNVPTGVDGYNPVVVNVPTGGSGGNDTEILSGTISGSYTNNTVTKLRAYSFAWCDNLTSVSCPNVTDTGGYIFYGNDNLVSVSFPALEELSGNLFNSCTKLSSVNLSGAKTIGAEAFYDLPSLTRLDLPSATLIKARAIIAQAVDVLILRSPTMCVLENRNGISNTLVDTTGYIYVPAALLNTYKADSVWGEFSERFRTIEAYPDICG